MEQRVSMNTKNGEWAFLDDAIASLANNARSDHISGAPRVSVDGLFRPAARSPTALSTAAAAR